MKKKITVVFDTDEDDEGIFKSALEFGLEKAGTYAEIKSIKIESVKENPFKFEPRKSWEESKKIRKTRQH